MVIDSIENVQYISLIWFVPTYMQSAAKERISTLVYSSRDQYALKI